ncbi:MAG: TraB/GumN family protein [Erysipelotrichaceae bacterium]
MNEKVIQIDYKDKKIFLIPTAHVSKDSAKLVEETIDEINPDSICIELDQGRYNTMSDPEKYRQTDVVKIIKNKQVTMMLANLILANYQRKIAANLQSETGKEMMVGIEKAKQLNARLILADRDIKITFSRIWSSLSFKEKLKLISVIVSAIFDDEEISEEDLADLQQSDMLTAALDEVSKQFPSVKKVLVDERDMYLAHKIKQAPGNTIVAILGAAHCVNVPKYIEQDYDISQFDTVKKKSTWQKAIGWIIPIIIIIAILFCFKLDANIGINQIKSWILINGTFAAIGVIIANGNILSALLAFLVAPISSLNPLLAAGWFSGLLEAKVIKPTVKDFDDLNKDLNSFKGFRTNKVTRILMVVAFANLGSSIGTFVAGLDIVKAIFNLI